MSVTISALSGVTPAAIILFQSIMFHWLGFAQAPGHIQAAGSRTVVAEQSAEQSAEKGAIEEGFTSLFNGSSLDGCCLLYTSPSPRDQRGSRMPSSA